MIRFIRSKSKNGFSILEVVFAFALLELVMLALIGAFPAVARLNKNAKFLSYANQYAQEKMEEIISQQYVLSPGKLPGNFSSDKAVEYAKGTWSQYDELPSPEQAGETGAPTMFTRIWWAEDISSVSHIKTGNSVLQSVTVRVLWKEGTREKSVDLVCQCVLIYRESALSEKE